MIIEIQEKDKKISKALDTLKKAKSSIEKKDLLIKDKESEILICNEDLDKKDLDIESLRADLENAYA
jgi:hypothetical protein